MSMFGYSVRPTYGKFGVYEYTGEGRAKVIHEGSYDECQAYMRFVNGELKNVFGIQPDGWEQDKDFIMFLDRCIQKGIDSLYDADSYAWLNTLFGYDIGWGRAQAIITYFYANDSAVSELTAENSREELENVNEIYNLSLTFDMWPEKNPKGIYYDWQQKEEEKS